MNFKNKISFLIIGFALVFFTISESISYKIALEHKMEELYEENKLIYKNLIKAQSNNLKILADILLSDHIVAESFLENNPQLIQSHFSPIWEKVKKNKFVHEIHFFKPPAESFVNFSNFESIGNDVSTVRTDIVLATTLFKESTHAMMSKTYAGIHTTSPIFDKNKKIIGGLSLGRKIDWLPKILKEKTELDSFLVYNKKATKSLGGKYYEQFVKDKEIIGKYILADKTLLVSKEEILSIDFSKKIQTVKISEQEYTLLIYEVIDFNKNTMAYVGVLTQLERFKADIFERISKDFLIFMLSALFILFFVSYRIKKLFKHIHSLRLLTLEIKNRNFSVLLNIQDTKISPADEALYKLENNIIEMGIELEKQYIVLKDDNVEQAKQLIEQLYRDNLTHLGNRNALVRDLVKNKERYVAVFNIRGFRSINDAFGFATGNIILKTLAKEFKDFSEINEMLTYKIGSDEFVLVNTNTIAKEKFLTLLKKHIQKVQNKVFRFENHKIDMKIVFYIGVCLEKNDRIHKVDRALTKAKNTQKELVIYSESENTASIHLNNLKILHKVDQALEEDNIVVYYQPIVDTATKIIKYEALVRLIDDGKVLSPYHFLEISKKTKSYSKITHVVIEKSFKKFEGQSSLISINIAADDILNEKTITLLYKKLDQCDNPQNIVLELIESDDLYNIPEVIEFINNVKSRGAKIAIDDFGTGYSNFSYMMKIKPDYLKIDASLIKNLDSDANAYKIVTAIVKFAHALKITTVAEFVHSEEIFFICKEIGIDEFQGYYFGEPKSELIG